MIQSYKYLLVFDNCCSGEEVEQYLLNSMEREIPTSTIGELIMKRLKGIDQVAYVRFVSVYRSFEDVDSFLAELNLLRTGD